jgi:hypothetical protein
MGFLGEIFNDVVDIATFPARVVGKVADDVLDSDIEEWVEETTESIKVEEKK